MRFQVLGPVMAYDGDAPVVLGGPKPRLLLAALLSEAGRVVGGDRLVDILWGGSPPGACRALVQTYVSSLRKVLTRPDGGRAIVTRPPGYLIEVGADELDSVVFERLVGEGRAAARARKHGAAVQTFRAAEALWRGEPFGGVGSPALARVGERLTELRLSAAEERIAAEMELGHEHDVLVELTALVAAHPTRERLRAQLMVALYRLGRQADALDVFGQGREALAHRLGIDPGPDLRHTHEAILRADPGLLRLPSGAPSSDRDRAGDELVLPSEPGATPVIRPAQLPVVPADFTGRDEQIAELVELIRPDPVRVAGATAICVVTGASGVGKSTLVLRVGHESAADFPDGQLYADLRGSTDTPAQPADVLGRFLRAFDPGAVVPESLDERAERFRTVLAKRRVLVLLDDAADEQQVRPLLPSGRGNTVVVTARQHLSGLAGAGHRDLGMLSEPEAVRLLGRVAGEKRVGNAPRSAREIVALCGCLPLAVRIVGARLASRPHWTLAGMVSRLADETRRLDEISVADQRVVPGIELAYRGLGPQARAALRWLGWLGLPDFPAWIIAPLLGICVDDAETTIEELLDAKTVDVVRVDGLGLARYRMHELVRVYAGQRAGEPGRRQALTTSVRRLMLAWVWLIRAHSDSARTQPISFRPATPPPIPPEDTVSALVQANLPAWLDCEQYSFVRAIDRAAALDLADASAALAAAFYRSGHPLGDVLESFLLAHSSAIETARRTADRAAEALLRTQLGQLCCDRDRFAESRLHLLDALRILRTLGDHHAEAVALVALGTTLRPHGPTHEALDAVRQAHAYFVAATPPSAVVGFTARLLGLILLDQGDFEGARTHLADAVAANRRGGSRLGEASSICGLSMVHRAMGDLDRALELGVTALEIARSTGDEAYEAMIAQAVAKTLIRLGRCDEALPMLTDTLDTCRRLGDRWGAALTARTRGELHLAAGRPDQAEPDLSRAYAMFTAFDAPIMRARTERDLADLRDAQGDPSAAATLRRTALATFAAYGTREYHELTENRRAAESHR